MRRVWRMLTVLVMLAGLIVMTPVGQVGPAGVVGTGNPGSCTDAALDLALAGGGSVTFNCGANPVTIIVSEKTISADTQIDGSGLITLSGNDANRILLVDERVSLTLDNITLSNGEVADGDFGDFGGAIRSFGTVTISNSTFSDNNAGGGDTGGFGGAINNFDSALSICNSTFNENNASGGVSGGSGGAINNFGSMLAIGNSTFSDNTGDNVGGEVHNDDSTLTIAATVMNNNTAGSGANCSNSGTIISQGYNLTDDASCNVTATGDIQNSANINLGPLGNYGGPTQTMLPGPGSDAIDSSDCFVAQDQRGVSRPQGSTCDRGSVELGRSARYALCASYFTGVVTSPLWGGCGAGQIAVAVPGNLSFCINAYTGQVTYRFGQPCTPPTWTHTLPDDGDLLTCVNLYTGANRWVLNHSQCGEYETPNAIPATP